MKSELEMIEEQIPVLTEEQTEEQTPDLAEEQTPAPIEDPTPDLSGTDAQVLIEALKGLCACEDVLIGFLTVSGADPNPSGDAFLAARSALRRVGVDPDAP